MVPERVMAPERPVVYAPGLITGKFPASGKSGWTMGPRNLPKAAILPGNRDAGVLG
jgi:hypothetical protein